MRPDGSPMNRPCLGDKNSVLAGVYDHVFNKMAASVLTVPVPPTGTEDKK